MNGSKGKKSPHRVLLELKKKYARLSKSNPDQFDAMLVSQCNFLFNSYTDIYNKIKRR